MKLGVLSQWYDPEPGPAALPGVYAREFSARGNDVHVLTGFPNYPDGKLYEGYKISRRRTEKRDGFDVDRVALYPQHSASAVGRILNYASFAASATLSGRHALRDIDALWVYNSPITVSLPLLTHTRMGKIPFFLHVQDLWPDSLVDSGMMPDGALGDSIAKLVKKVVHLTERKAAVIGVSSLSARRIILERNSSIDPSKIVYAPNPTNESLFRPVGEIRAALALDSVADVETVNVMYAGAVGEVQGLDTLLDAAVLLRTHSRIKFTVVGDGISRERLERRAAHSDISNVKFLGRVPQHEIPGLVARAHVQIVSLADAPFLSYTTPSKIASLMAMGVPIVGHLRGDGARLIEDAKAGAVVAPGDAAALASVIGAMAEAGPSAWSEYGASARRYYETHLSVASTTDTILHSLAETTSARA